MIKRQLLIIGTGRSGTLYTSRVFRAAGLDLQHERMGVFGCVSMYFVPFVTDCSIVNDGQKQPIHDGEHRTDYEFAHIWHQVRDPLKTIDSLAKSFTRKVRVWTARQLHVSMPGLSSELRCPFEDKLVWALRYWVDANLLCEMQTAWRFRVEEFPWSEMQSRLGLDVGELPVVKTTTNRNLRYAMKSKEQIQRINDEMYNTTWDRLLSLDVAYAKKAQQMAVVYGYMI